MSNCLFLLSQEEYKRMITSFETKGSKDKDLRFLLQKMRCQYEYNVHIEEMHEVRQKVKELFG